MKNKKLITKGITICLALLIAGSLTACKKEVENKTTTKEDSSGYNELLDETLAEGETVTEENTSETETSSQKEAEDKGSVTTANNKGNSKTQTTTKKTSQEQPANNTTKPQEPAAPPTTSAPKPTEPETPAPPAGDGKVTQERRDYMTNKIIAKALEVGFTTAMRDNTGEITGNYSGAANRVTPENYDIIYNSWVNSNDIELYHKYDGFNQLFVEWKNCGDYWEIYLKFYK